MYEQDLPVLRQSPLLRGFSDLEILLLMDCLDALRQSYHHRETVVHTGGTIHRVAFVVEGTLDVFEEDYWGNQALFGWFGPGETWGDAFIVTGNSIYPFTVRAYGKTALYFIDYKRALAPCPKHCPHHMRLVRNLLEILSTKTLGLLDKVSIVTKRSIRDKLLTYLSKQANLAGSNRFTIPLNRLGLANYLSVDRSALSSELSRMEKDGLLSYHRNTFELHQGEERP